MMGIHLPSPDFGWTRRASPGGKRRPTPTLQLSKLSPQTQGRARDLAGRDSNPRGFWRLNPVIAARSQARRLAAATDRHCIQSEPAPSRLWFFPTPPTYKRLAPHSHEVLLGCYLLCLVSHPFIHSANTEDSFCAVRWKQPSVKASARGRRGRAGRGPCTLPRGPCWRNQGRTEFRWSWKGAAGTAPRPPTPRPSCWGAAMAGPFPPTPKRCPGLGLHPLSAGLWPQPPNGFRAFLFPVSSPLSILRPDCP